MNDDNRANVIRIMKRDEKLQDAIKQFNRHCKHCGHTMTVMNADRVLCTWCGHWIYYDEKTEFKYKMLEQMRKKGN